MEDRTSIRKLSFSWWLKPEVVFLSLFLILSTAAALLTPMGAGPDEPSHIARAEQVAHGVLVTPRIEVSKLDKHLSGVADTSQSVYGGFQDYGLIHTAVQNMRSYQALKDTYSFPIWTSPRLVTHDRVGERTVGFAFSNSAINSPLVYLPQVILFRVAGLFTESAWWLIFAMRMGGVLALALSLFLCIRAIPIGKWFMAVFGLLPSTVLINTAVTADTVTLICCLALITALLVAWMYDDEPISKLTWFILALSSLCMGMVKLSYLPLIFLLLLLPILRSELRTRQAYIGIGSIILISLIIFLIWYFQIHAVNTGVLYSADIKPGLQKEFILEHPGFFAKNLITLFLSLDFFQVSNFGVLSMRSTSVECGWFYLLLIIISLAIPDSRERDLAKVERGNWWVVSTFVLLYLAIFVLISTALYLQFTPPGAPFISGVQSRYFSPILPLLLLSVILVARWVLAPRIDTDPGKHVAFLAESRDLVLIKIVACAMTVSVLIMLMDLSKVVYDNGFLLR